jgi:hypothetical protein
MTDRLRCIDPPAAVDVYYSPSLDRIILSGVNGYASGHYISLAADSESYYGDTSPIQVANGNGQRCICAREFQGAVYSLKERSGFTITPLASDPSTWQVNQRWGAADGDGVGPCGPRAACATNEFLFFVHRSGGYAYNPDQSMPMLLTGEMPGIPSGFWATINWDAEKKVWCCNDQENKELRIGLPVNGSPVPNQTLTMNYSEGLQGPIKFTAMDGNERFVPGGRKWSLDDLVANVAAKVERVLPLNASPFAVQRQRQILLGSSSPDGTVQAITMGVYNDNGQGIDCQYETACAPLEGVQMLGGVSVNALGSGAMTVSVPVGAVLVNSPGVGGQGLPQTREAVLQPALLTPVQWKGYDAGVRGVNDEYFRLRFTNGKKADSWFGVKHATLWARPIYSGRTGGGN